MAARSGSGCAGQTWNQGLVTSQGDFSAGGVLAHEWGHAVDSMTRTRAGNYKDEYHADCMAGLSTRYAYVGGRLLEPSFWRFFFFFFFCRRPPT